MMNDDIKISGHAGFTMGPVARWVCVNAGKDTVAYVDTIERAQGFIGNANSAEREAVLVEALTSAQHAIYILEAHIDFIADGQQPEEHDGGCIALAKSQCRDALATVSDTAEKE